MELERILAATDLSASNGEVLRVAAALALKVGARLTLIHVISQARLKQRAGSAIPPPPLDTVYRDGGAEVVDQFRSAVPPHVRQRLTVDLKVTSGKPSDEILDVARRMSADLIVLCADRRRGFLRGMRSGPTERVAWEASCPVLIVGVPKDPADAPADAQTPCRSVAACHSGGGEGGTALAHAWRQRRCLAMGLLAAALGTVALIVGVPPGRSKPPIQGGEAPWTARTRQATQSLLEGNPGGAERALHNAYLEAIGSQRWEALVSVGDAYRRIADAEGSRDRFAERIFRIYAAAAITARLQGSVEGLVGAAEGYAFMEQPEVAERILALASYVATRKHDLRALELVRNLQRRLKTGLPAGQIFVRASVP